MTSFVYVAGIVVAFGWQMQLRRCATRQELLHFPPMSAVIGMSIFWPATFVLGVLMLFLL